MTRGNSPADLGAQLRAGDEAVLEVILRTHGPPILALLKQRFVGPLMATDFEDVLAAALFRMWQHRTKFDPTLASLRVWFFRIAENVARDVLKHGWHKARRLELSLEPDLLATATDRRWSDSETEETSDGADGAATKLRISSGTAAGIAGAATRATTPHRSGRCRLADGLVASQNLAQELGIPPGTVRVYRRRALERLRREIEQREVADRSVEADV